MPAAAHRARSPSSAPPPTPDPVCLRRFHSRTRSRPCDPTGHPWEPTGLPSEAPDIPGTHRPSLEALTDTTRPAGSYGQEVRACHTHAASTLQGT
ncbi:hypothetical protein FRAAL0842 [Frankia alni ACN14a]|uniref:Uncharacterized protein n=1 Tax=Frankia alni (strain DSM 45986 / CECT 9034 / ACN14a) TaxID=326424 RepID=Q0RSF3_FRAAA|nr:hypothetical protein FRAAL0842 [Frankia alni ACN14a]